MRSLRSIYTTFLSTVLITSCNQTVAPPAPLLPVPNEAQLVWHEMEMQAFVHFTINTFTDKEWGYGDESPELFNPGALDVDQWVRLFDELGFKGVILTCKHHDGFCLWPSAYTQHSIAASPYKDGGGDIVHEVAEACKTYGLHLGIYLSPWDRNHAAYGTPEYVVYYRNQLRELFERYSPVFEMWFDGANGGDGYYGGARETRRIDGSTYYDWPATLDLVRSMEPEVIFFSDAGPGVRWVGNERGVAGETNWNMITPDTLYAGKPGIERLLNTGSEDGTHWIPAETDVSIRPGWFYHEREDSLVKSAERLFEIYLTSVGRGSTLLLNIPPDKRGLIHENDVAALRGFRKILDEEFRTNLATKAQIIAGSFRGNDDRYSAGKMTDGDMDTFWALDDGAHAGTFEIQFELPERVKYVVLQENIRLGQRVKAFSIDALIDDTWKRVGQGTTIGYKKILRIDEPLKTRSLRVKIEDSRGCVVIGELGVY